jgi:hypothetical protein
LEPCSASNSTGGHTQAFKQPSILLAAARSPPQLTNNPTALQDQLQGRQLCVRVGQQQRALEARRAHGYTPQALAHKMPQPPYPVCPRVRLAASYGLRQRPSPQTSQSFLCRVRVTSSSAIAAPPPSESRGAHGGACRSSFSIILDGLRQPCPSSVESRRQLLGGLARRSLLGLFLHLGAPRTALAKAERKREICENCEL